MNIHTRLIPLFLPLAAGLTLVMAVAYVNEQQILRMGANEPQIGMAIDAANAIAAGAQPSDVATGTPLAIEKGIGPYVVVYDAGGKPVAGTGMLHGQLPVPPLGIFDEAKRKGSDMLTWQPESGVRQAIVVEPVKDEAGGYVLAGRSLSYVEWEEDQLLKRTLVGWAFTMLGSFVVFWLVLRVLRRSRTSS